MAQTGYFPPRNSVPSQHRRQNQIDNVGSGRSKTAWSGDNGYIIFITHQQQIAGLDGSQKPFDVAADAGHPAADYVFRARR
jgi:hypothetical protein